EPRRAEEGGEEERDEEPSTSPAESLPHARAERRPRRDRVAAQPREDALLRRIRRDADEGHHEGREREPEAEDAHVLVLRRLDRDERARERAAREEDEDH